MQGCTTYIQPSQGCVHLAKNDHKVVCTLQMQGCNKLAARLPQPRNFHMGKANAIAFGNDPGKQNFART